MVVMVVQEVEELVKVVLVPHYQVVQETLLAHHQVKEIMVEVMYHKIIMDQEEEEVVEL
jgi:hypothetical protein